MVQQHALRVKKIENLTPTVFQLSAEVEGGLIFRAGQFLSVVIPTSYPLNQAGRELRRAYSIASSPENPLIELCIKRVEEGPGSGYLASLSPGDVFQAYAPYGDFTWQVRPGRDAYFLATGTGIAPFRAMILSREFALNPPTNAVCVLGVRAVDEVLYREDFNSDTPGRVRLVVAVSKPPTREQTRHAATFSGRITDYMRRKLAEPGFAVETTDFYLCGNGAMITEMKALLQERGVQKDAIHSEVYYR